MIRHLGAAAALLSFAICLSNQPGTLQAAETPLQRGAYLVRGLVACGNCHTPKGPDGVALADKELAGGFVIDEPPFRAVGSNITPDKETGIGSWTDQQIIDAIRNGKRPDGSLIGPPMPIPSYRHMSDSDVKAIVAYLRSVKPVSNKVEKSNYRVPLPPDWGPPVTRVPEVSRANAVTYGRYLSEIAHCMECHTPMVKGQPDLSRIGAGGLTLPALPEGHVISANLTPANPDGIARWTNAQVKTSITNGIRPDGRQLVRIMPFDWYKNTSQPDLDALVAYLRTLKPAKPQ